MLKSLANTPLWLFFVPLTMIIAFFKGRRLFLWGALGYFLGPVALVVVLVRVSLPRKQYRLLEEIRFRASSNALQERNADSPAPADFLLKIKPKSEDDK